MKKEKHLKTGLVVEDINDYLVVLDYLEWLQFINWWESARDTIAEL